MGDSETTGWLSLVDSGTTITKSHTYYSPMTYTIKAYTRDTDNMESDFSAHDIQIKKSKNRGLIFCDFLELFLSRFPMIERLFHMALNNFNF